MLSTRELFYGQTEPVWILKTEKKDDNKKRDDKNASTGKKGSDKVEYPIHTSVSYYPYFMFTSEYVPSPAKKDNDAKGKTDSKGTDKKKETKIEMKVPICCSECESSVKNVLFGLKGVKSVDCNTNREKVTVVATTAAPADILLVCRKVFKKSRMWSDDD